MSKKIWLASTALLALLSAPLRGQETRNYIPLTRIGTEHFPVSEHALLKLRDDQDVDAMRMHAWNLFAGLVAAKSGSGTVPIWNTWYTKCDLHLKACQSLPLHPNNRQRMLQALDLPLQNFTSLLSINGELSNSEQAATSNDVRKNIPLNDAIDRLLKAVEGTPNLAHVLYNAPAADNILKHRLFSTAGLNEFLKRRLDIHSPEGESEIPPFSNDSIALKLDWYVVFEDPENPKTTYPFQLYDRGPDGKGSVTADTVILSLARTSCDHRDYVVSKGARAVEVPLGCVYAVKVQPNLEDWKLLNIQNPGTTSPVYLVLRALHVATKETGDWVWTTFWWSNHPRESPYSCDQTCEKVLLENKWRHFLMDTTLSDKTPLEIDDGRKICFNPFLELRAIDSNCVQCHRRAAYLAANPKLKFQCGNEIGSARRCSETGIGSLPSCSLTRPACTEGYFKGTLQTDFLWTIVEAQNEQDKTGGVVMQMLREHFAIFFRQLYMQATH